MRFRSRPSSGLSSTALCLAAALAAAGFVHDAGAQGLDLRGGDDPAAPARAAFAPRLAQDAGAPQPLRRSRADADEAVPPIVSRPSDDPGAPNYGRARPRKAKLYRPSLRGSPPLAALVPYRGAPGQPKGLLNPAPPPRDAIDPAQPGPTVAVLPSPLRQRRPPVEDDPFAPLGVRAGALRLFPFLEAGGGYETNPNQTSAGVRASPVLRAAGGLDVRSDFSAHSLTASLRGGYSDFPRNAQANRPDANGVVDGRIDVTRDDRVDLEGRFAIATQTPGSPLLAVPGSVFITNRPTIVSAGATLGGAHAFNRLSLGLRATFDRTQYGDATQSDGTRFRFSQDNYNDYGLIARAAYEVTPGIVPFLEVGADTRVRDNVLDTSGYARNSRGVLARAGSTFEFSRLLTGTASGGYAQRHYDDPRLPDLRGPTFDAALVYGFSPLTTLTLRSATILSETTLAGASGAVSRIASLEVAHTFFRHFTVGGIATYQVNQYQGASVHETFTQGTLKAAYSFTREVQLIASATRQRLDSSLLGSSYTDTIFLVGVRLQR